MPHFVVTFGTKQVMLDCSTEERAVQEFIDTKFPKSNFEHGGRLMPPIPEEVSVRRATAEDHALFDGEKARHEKIKPPKKRSRL